MRKRWLVGGLVVALATCGVAAGAAGPVMEAPPAKKQAGQPIQIELRDGLTLAANQLSIDRGGRVGLDRVRIALSGDRLALRARRAIVEFDRPVGKIADLGRHKLVSVMLTGGVSCTMGRDQDLVAETIKVSWAATGEVLFEAQGEVSAHLPGVTVGGVESFSLRFEVGPAPKGKAPPGKGP